VATIVRQLVGQRLYRGVGQQQRRLATLDLEILESTGKELLAKIVPQTESPDVVPSAAVIWAVTLSNFVGSRIHALNSTSSRWSRDKEPYAQELRQILEACIKVHPGDATNRFRLGSLFCLLGDRASALQQFRCAGDLMTEAGQYERIDLQVRAEGAYREWLSDKQYYDFDLLAVQFAAWAVAAVYAGVGERIRDKLDGKGEANAETAENRLRFWFFRQGAAAIALEVVRQVLNEMLVPVTAVAVPAQSIDQTELHDQSIQLGDMLARPGGGEP
jgi:hypothetical protein